MAVGRLRELCDRLEHEAGYPGSCPVGIVERASCPGQRVVQVSFNPSQDTIFLPSSSYRTSRLNLTISSWNSFLKCKPLDCDALCHAAPLLLAPVCFPVYSSALIMRRIKGTVATIADLADELEVQAPATIIFGEVVRTLNGDRSGLVELPYPS